jgi:ferrous iron transport protein A
VFDHEKILPLELVEAGEWADVEEVTGTTTWVNRLGVRCGSRLRILRQGSPCLLQVDGTRLSVRRDSAAQILVRPVAV